jgi:hypothetical protein
MMLALLIYAYCCGVYSSRKIAAATYDIIPFRVLSGDQHPHFTVINEFRLRHLDGFVDLFVQVLRLCGRAGLIRLEHVALDGSKVDANASKHLSSHSKISFPMISTHIVRTAVLTPDLTMPIRDARSASLGARAAEPRQCPSLAGFMLQGAMRYGLLALDRQQRQPAAPQDRLRNRSQQQVFNGG